MDGPTIAATIKNLQMGFQAINGILKMNVGSKVEIKVVELKGVIIDVQDKLLAMQTNHSEMIKRIDSLERENKHLKSMEAEREKYQLHPVGVGAVVYILKPSVDLGEPAHWLCVNCFDQGRKSILQKRRHDGRGDEVDYSCPNCPSSINVPQRTRIKRLSQDDIDRETRLREGRAPD